MPAPLWLSTVLVPVVGMQHCPPPAGVPVALHWVLPVVHALQALPAPVPQAEGQGAALLRVPVLQAVCPVLDPLPVVLRLLLQAPLPQVHRGVQGRWLVVPLVPVPPPLEHARARRLHPLPLLRLVVLVPLPVGHGVPRSARRRFVRQPLPPLKLALLLLAPLLV